MSDAPRNTQPTEKPAESASGALSLLKQLCAQVLGCEAVDGQDNFFALGGDSILALTLIARLRKQGWKLLPGDLFNAPDMAAAAASMTSLELAPPSTAQHVPPATARLTLSPMQRRFLSQLPPHAGHWNQSLLLRLQPDMSDDRVACALNRVLANHPMLRCQFIPSTDGSGWQAHIGDDKTFPLHTCEVADAALIGAHIEHAQRRLSLQQGPLCCALLIHQPARAPELLLVVHHLVIDGVSWQALLGDLEIALNSASATLTPPSCEPAQYGRLWQHLQQASAPDSEQGRLLAQWQQALSNCDAQPPSLPSQATHGESRLLSQHLPLTQTEAIHERLYAAFSSALSRWLPGHTLAIDSEGHGRGDAMAAGIDLSHAIGWFTALYTLPLPLHRDPRTALSALNPILERARRVGDHLSLARADSLLKRGKDQGSTLRFHYLGRISTDNGAGRQLVPIRPPVMDERDPRAPLQYVLDVDARVSDQQLEVNWRYLPGSLAAADLQRLTDGFREAWSMLDNQASVADDTAESPAITDETRRYPLSALQQGMLLHAMDATREANGNRTGDYIGQLRLTLWLSDPAALVRAWHNAVARHPILRTRILWQQGESPCQTVSPSARLDLTEIDGRNRAKTGEWLEQLAEEQRAQGFDLQQPPLMRLLLIRLPTDADCAPTPGAERYHLIWTRHHILLDGISSALLLREVLATINPSAVTAQPEPSPHCYPAFVHWLETQDGEAAREYWRRRLQPLHTPTLIARQLPPPATTQAAAAARQNIELQLEGDNARRVLNRAREGRITAHTLIGGLWAILLSRLTRESTVSFATPISLRRDQIEGIDRALGLFLNTVPVVCRLDSALGDGRPSALIDWLQTLQQRQFEDFEHAWLPLADIQQQHDSRGSLFDSMLVSNPGLRQSDLDHFGIQVEQAVEFDTNHYALTLTSSLAEDSLHIRFGFDSNRLALAQVEPLVSAMTRLLEQFADDPHRPLNELDLWPPAPDDTLPEQAAPALLLQRITEFAHVRGDCLAIATADRQLDYAELERRSNRLAHRLNTLGVRAGGIVAIQQAPTIETVVLMLAVMKTGAAYLPLEPDLPSARRETLLSLAGPDLLVSDDTDPPAGYSAVTLEHLTASAGDCDDTRAPEPVAGSGQRRAYLIFTSGSSGTPKPVAVTQQALAHYCHSLSARIGLEPDWRCGLISTLAADLGHSSLFGALYVGATLCPAPEQAMRDGDTFRRWMQRMQIDLLKAVPGHLHALLDAAQLLDASGTGTLPRRALLLGGEPLPPAFANRLLQQAQCSAPGMRLFNHYGPTETTVGVLMHAIEHSIETAQVPLGTPLAHVRLCITDSQGEPLPRGLPGELWIGGPSLADGYWQAEEATNQQFVVDARGLRWYRSGDRVYQDDQERYCFLGRLDDQVKIRGYRIEPGEIEAQLTQHPEVKRARVLLHTSGAGEGTLTAYVECTPTRCSEAALRDWLSARLPAAWCPDSILLLEQMPLTRNGKLDTRALPPLSTAEALPQHAAIPLSDTEHQLAGLWQQLLGGPLPERNSHFFACGGHSLLTIRLNALIQRHFGISLPVRQLFETPRLADLAAAIDAQGRDTQPLDQLDALLDELEEIE
ncbi:MAG: amino acid adenylation domain-containing protein [Oceanospirillales bacterium]|nr:amino acid adenylation domain-containing protein [Oceanospirillales bacterium]